MFKKILIANRGEIACRVMRTAKAMGIRTVAIHSDVDADARHVREADEAVLVGPAPSAQSYLNVEAILRAIAQTGAEGVHPGYGFLSENAAFAAAVEKAGARFIGPSPSAIAAMGDKIRSKQLAREAGVSVVPGGVESVADEEAAREAAAAIGYPVLVKASAGGGGKGMRLVRGEAEMADALRSAAHEAKASFGDERVFVEKFIEHPRHIEIQVLADSYGHVIHLGERECSIQRRHQKVIEESPSPLLDAKTRAAMGAQAVALAQAVEYRSAGTVEFIADRNKNFYFLEMNTRLQVEHPVTEKVTGLDLVEWMIRIAAGERLTLKQKDVRLDGWAIEARLYAEDPTRGFLPASGRVVRYREPTGAGVRIDSGIHEGAEVTVHYDPILAKIVTHAADRDGAVALMRHALDSCCVRGVVNNGLFLGAVMANPRFQSGDISTAFIQEEFGAAFDPAKAGKEQLAVLVAVAATLHHRLHARDAAIGGGQNAQRVASGAEWVVLANGDSHKATVAETAGGHAAVTSSDSHEVIGEWRFDDPVFRGAVNGRPVAVQVERIGLAYRLSHDGVRLDLQVLAPRAAELAALMPAKKKQDMSRFVLSPMPGLLSSLAVAVGQDVKAGEAIAVIEAMKMENVLRAERDGRVAALRAKPGDSLAADQPILEFE